MSGFDFNPCIERDPHVDNIYVLYAETKHKLLSHLLEHLGYSVTGLQQDYDLRQQLQRDIHWEKYNYEACKEYLSYKDIRVGHVAIVYDDLSCYVEGKIYETFI
jgi:hypothetical protein|tara:strand:+ start:171 stop:482 length:312 start_codon:yes stop_codon:yes gene_type:complete